MATEKQKRAIAKVIENHGNVSKSMIEAGYTPASAKNPKNLTQSQAFQKYMEEAGVTDQKLVQVIKDGLNASKTIVMGKEEDSFVDIQPDHPTRHKFLETTLKLKGLSKDTNSSTVIFNQGDLVKSKYVKD